MSERTEQLSQINQWQNLRERFIAGWSLGAACTLALLLVTDGDQESATGLPLSLVFAATAGLAAALGLVFIGMMVRWQTLPRRVTLPLCWLLLIAGTGAAAFCILRTAEAPRAPIGSAELQHAPAYFAGLAAAVFGAVNWPGRPRR